MLKVHIDFETRSECDLIECGAWIYSRHPSTEVTCIGYAFGDTPVRIIRREDIFKHNELIDVIREPDVLIAAHNAGFEFVIWNNVLCRNKAYNPLKIPQMRDTAAKSLACGLPISLGDVANVLRLDFKKDAIGYQTMMKLCKPVTDNRSKWFGGYNEDPELYEILYKYCARDVEVEREIDHKLPELSPEELEIYQETFRINTEGVCVDTQLIKAAIALNKEMAETANKKIFAITGGFVSSYTKPAKIVEFLQSKGEAIDELHADDLDSAIERVKSEDSKEVLRIRKRMARASVKKFNAFDRMTDTDGRIRDLMIYHHSETGRFGARGAQILNLAKGEVDDMDSQCQDIIDLDVASLDFLYGDANHAVGDCVRGAVIPSPGKKLFVEDYASIEARVLFWLADEEKGLQQFRNKADLYVDMARVIFDNNNLTKSDNPKERFLGKQVVLGCGYSMGWKTFKKTCKDQHGLDLTNLAIEYVGDYYPDFVKDSANWFKFQKENKESAQSYESWALEFVDKDKFFSTLNYFGIDPLSEIDPEKIDLGDYFAKKVIKSYRSTYTKVTQFWYDCEKAAKAAIVTKSTQRVGRVHFGYRPGVLMIKLPSGRVLYYWDPTIKYKEVSEKQKAKLIEDGDEWKLEKEQIHYYHVDSTTKRWTQTTIYGGKIVDHITQGTARDIMCNGVRNVKKDGTFELLFTPHDELVTEAPEDTDSKKLGYLMRLLPLWGVGIPLESEGWEGYRYRK